MALSSAASTDDPLPPDAKSSGCRIVTACEENDVNIWQFRDELVSD
jgi:hypothetical protein